MADRVSGHERDVEGENAKTVRFANSLLQAGFTMVPNLVLLDERLSPLAVRLYGLLAYYARQDEDCWPGQDTLVAQANASERSVRGALRHLEELGLLQSRRRGSGKTNVYTLLDPASTEPSSDRQILPVTGPDGLTGKSCRSRPANAAGLDRQILPVLKDEEDAVEVERLLSPTETTASEQESASANTRETRQPSSSIDRARELYPTLTDDDEKSVLWSLVAVAQARDLTTGWDPAAALDLVRHTFRNRDIAGEGDKFRAYYSPGGLGENRPIRNLVARWREWLNRAPTLDTVTARQRGTTDPRRPVKATAAAEREAARAERTTRRLASVHRLTGRDPESEAA